MENLIFCLNATVPIFFTMLLGVFFRKIGLFTEQFVSVLNRFVFSAALPALLFEDISNANFLHVWDGRLVLFCFLVTFVSILISFGFSFLLKDKSIQGEFIQGSYRSSAALLGMAFIQNIYGSSAMGPLMIIGTVPLYNVVAVAVLEIMKPGKKIQDHKKLILRTLGGIVQNPIILGILLGVLWSVLRLPKPLVLTQTVHNLGLLATPLGLMAMGTSFRLDKAAGCLKPAVLCSFLKLIGFTAIFLPLAIHMGFTQDKLVSILVMLGSATTVSCFIMAKNMGHDGALSSIVIMLTTVFSAFTLTGWLYLLKTMNLL
ncbi:MAG: AEC family transporter [Blautia sp.]